MARSGGRRPQTRLQNTADRRAVEAARARGDERVTGRVLQGPSGSRPQSTTNARVGQQGGLTMQGPQRPGGVRPPGGDTTPPGGGGGGGQRRGGYMTYTVRATGDTTRNPELARYVPTDLARNAPMRRSPMEQAVGGATKFLGRAATLLQAATVDVANPRPAAAQQMTKAAQDKEYSRQKKEYQSKQDKGSFDSAFGTARKQGAKEFTWRGRQYNTKLKGQ
jgi:hypothetical protein